MIYRMLNYFLMPAIMVNGILAVVRREEYY